MFKVINIVLFICIVIVKILYVISICKKKNWLFLFYDYVLEINFIF